MKTEQAPRTRKKAPPPKTADVPQAILTRLPLSVFSFRLVFSGPTDVTEEIEDAIFEAGCNDALLGMRNGEWFLVFDRKAPTFRIALMSAVAHVERSGVPLELIRVEPVESLTRPAKQGGRP